MLLWWFGDGLGLLIYTPLLLALVQPAREAIRVNWQDGLVLLLKLALALLILSGQTERWGGVPLTPNLLLPSVLYVAVRFGTRWTSLAVALISLATAWAQTTGHQPFGAAPPYELILRTQEFILTLSIVGMGFAVLFSEQRALTRGLEDEVRERTPKDRSNRYCQEARRKLPCASGRRYSSTMSTRFGENSRTVNVLAETPCPRKPIVEVDSPAPSATTS